VSVASGLGLSRNLISTESIPWIYQRPVRVVYEKKDTKEITTTTHARVKQGQRILLGLDLEQVLEEYHFGSVFIDSRDTDEFLNGHVQGAISLPLSLAQQELPHEVNGLDRNERLILYCDESLCESSEELGGILMNRYGFTQVCIFKGGWEAWRDSGYPTERLVGLEEDGT